MKEWWLGYFMHSLMKQLVWSLSSLVLGGIGAIGVFGVRAIGAFDSLACLLGSLHSSSHLKATISYNYRIADPNDKQLILETLELQLNSGSLITIGQVNNSEVKESIQILEVISMYLGQELNSKSFAITILKNNAKFIENIKETFWRWFIWWKKKGAWHTKIVHLRKDH